MFRLLCHTEIKHQLAFFSDGLPIHVKLKTTGLSVQHEMII